MAVDGGDSVLPFVLQFYSEPSQYLWEDDTGDTHLIHQGEGGEQGDPLMPLLFSLGQHSRSPIFTVFPLQSFLPGEQLFAYLDLHVVCSPERVGAIFTRLESDLESHARPPGTSREDQGVGTELLWSLKRAVQCKRLRSVWTLTPQFGPVMVLCPQQGLRVLGIPIGTPEFVRSQDQFEAQGSLPTVTRVEDLQSAWLLLLLFCANTRHVFLWVASSGD